MNYETQFAEFLARAVLRYLDEGPWGGFFAAIIIFRLWRRTRYLKEALRRANERRLTELNETQRKLLEIFTAAPPPKLEDLANDSAKDWQLR